MGKLYNALIIVFAVNFALILFTSQSIPTSDLWKFLLSPFDWSNLSLYAFLSDTLLVAGVGAIILGSIWVKQDWIMYAGIAGVFLSFGATLFGAWTFFQSHMSSIVGCALPTACQQADYLATMFISPIILFYIVAIFEWVRSNK